MKLLLSTSELPGVIRESLRHALLSHGVELPDHVLHHAGGHIAQSLFSIDENPANRPDVDVEQLDDRDSDAPRLR